MRTTIKDVALKCGVSTATVSMVLNNKSISISEATKEKVRLCAKELNYRPNRLAYGMSKTKTDSISLILPNSQNPFFTGLAESIDYYAAKEKLTLYTCHSNDTPEKDIELIRSLCDHGMDGIILACTNMSPSQNSLYEAEIARSPIPIILLDRTFHAKHSSSVLSDNCTGGYLATKHLLEYGHTKIGCISGPKILPGCQSRLSGYQKALQEFHIDFDPDLVYWGDFSTTTGQNALPYLLKRGVTAIFALNDLIVLGVYKEAALCHLSIPDDISIIGFDDILFADLISPPLTTVAQPIDQIAESLVTKLSNLISDTTPCLTPKMLVPVLKIRGSTKPLSHSITS